MLRRLGQTVGDAHVNIITSVTDSKNLVWLTFFFLRKYPTLGGP